MRACHRVYAEPEPSPQLSCGDEWGSCLPSIRLHVLMLLQADAGQGREQVGSRPSRSSQEIGRVSGAQVQEE